MFTGPEIVDVLNELRITHVVWVPDSVLGMWEPSLESSTSVSLIRVCREGEAWPLAAGLLVAGASPLVMMQTTGLYESGDALRNVAFDLQLPVFALIGARNWLNESSQDSAKKFATPILNAWGIPWVTIGGPADKGRFAEHYRHCQHTQTPGIVMLAE